MLNQIKRHFSKNYFMTQKEVNEHSLPKIGSKSFNLLSKQADFLDNSISIPKTMAISVDLYYDIIERTGFRSLIDSELAHTNVKDEASRNQLVNTLFNSFPTVDDLVQKCPDQHRQLVEFYNQNFSTFKSIVVRSSPIMQGVSVFQQPTILNVTTLDGFIKAYLDVCRQLWTSNSLQPFFEGHVQEIPKIGMAHCIMRQVVTDYSFVVFTRMHHQFDEASEVLIHQTAGQGEQLTTGEIEPSQVKLVALQNKNGNVELVTAEHKAGSHVIPGCKMLTPNLNKPGLNLQEVPAKLRVTLKREVFKEIARQAKSLHALRKGAQQIEGCVEGDEIFIVETAEFEQGNKEFHYQTNNPTRTFQQVNKDKLKTTAFCTASNGGGSSATQGKLVFVDFDELTESVTKESVEKVNKVKGPVIVQSKNTPPSLAEICLHPNVKGVVSLHGSPTSHFSVLMGEKGKIQLSGLHCKQNDNQLETSRGLILHEFDDVTVDALGKQLFGQLIELKKLSENSSDVQETKLPIKLISSSINSYEEVMKFNARKPHGCGLYRIELGLIRENKLSLRSILTFNELNEYVNNPSNQANPDQEEQKKIVKDMRDVFIHIKPNPIEFLRYKMVGQLSNLLAFTKPEDDITIRFYDCKMGEEKDLLGENSRAVKEAFGDLPENPDLGMRGVRLLISYPKFREQLEEVELHAINQVADRFNRHINYMFPFITTNFEAKTLLDAGFHKLHKNVSFGFMVEVPSFNDVKSLALLIDQIEQKFDKNRFFLSMGTNDYSSLLEGKSRPDNIVVAGTGSGVATTTLLNIISIVQFCNLRKVRLGSCGNLPSHKKEVAGIMSCFMDPEIHSISVLGTAQINTTKNIHEIEGILKDMSLQQRVEYAEQLFMKLCRENGEFCSDDRLRQLYRSTIKQVENLL